MEAEEAAAAAAAVEEAEVSNVTVSSQTISLLLIYN